MRLLLTTDGWAQCADPQKALWDCLAEWAAASTAHRAFNWCSSPVPCKYAYSIQQEE